MNPVFHRLTKHHGTERERGFTLVELLIVLALTAILLAVGLPQLSQFSASRAMGSHVALLASAMRLARSEAIKRGTRVTVCPSMDPESAGGPACNGGANDWASGWVIFSDLGVANAIDGNDRVVRVQGPLSDSGGIQSLGGTAVNFFPNGIALGGQRTFDFLPLLATGDPTYNDTAQRMCLGNSGSTKRRNFTEAC